MTNVTKKETAETLIKWISTLVTVAGLLWGITTFLITARIQAETRQLEARKPFLERQLALYTEATQVTSILATSTDTQALEKARGRFLELYWGELALVEDKGVESAMVRFNTCLQENCSQKKLQPLALQLARACRESLATSWGVDDWKIKSATKEP